MFREELVWVAAVLRRRWKWGVMGFALGIGLVFLLLLVLPLRFSTEILFHYRESPPLLSPALPAEGMAGLGGLGTLGGFLGGGGTPLDDEITYLSSVETFLRAVEKLSPEDVASLTRSSPLRRPVNKIKRLLGLAGPPRPRNYRAAYRLRKRTEIRPVGLSRTLRIRYTDTDPDRLVRILGAIKEAVLERESLRQVEYFDKVYQALEDVTPVVEESLFVAKQTLLAFMDSSGLVMSPYQQIQGFAEALMEIETKRAGQVAFLASLRAQRNPTDSLLVTSLLSLQDSSSLQTWSAFAQWDSLVGLYTQYYQLLVQGKDPHDVSMQEMKARIQRARDLLAQQLDSVQEGGRFPLPPEVFDTLSTRSAMYAVIEASVRARLAALDQIRDSLQKEIRRLGQPLLDYTLLRARYTFFSGLQTALKTQSFQFRTMRDHPVGALHIVQDIHPPLAPDFPRPLIFALLGILLGVVLGAGGIVTAEIFNPRMDQMTLRRMGIPVLGTYGGDRGDFLVVAGRAIQWLREQKHPGVLGIIGVCSPEVQRHFLEVVLPGLTEAYAEVWIPEALAPDLSESLRERMHMHTLSSQALSRIAHPKGLSRAVIYFSPVSDTWLESLLASVDAALVVASDSISFETVVSWINQMEQTGTPIIGWLVIPEGKIESD